jgi:hypothetical protein
VSSDVESLSDRELIHQVALAARSLLEDAKKRAEANKREKDSSYQVSHTFKA